MKEKNHLNVTMHLNSELNFNFLSQDSPKNSQKHEKDAKRRTQILYNT